MKTAIKLALIYLAMQILGALAVGPFTMIYAYVKYGTVDRASEFALAPTLLAGFVFMLIYLIDFLMSHLTFLPDWLSDTFDLLQSGWLGIICVAILGPILEELLFRGAITKVLLKKYNPVVAILISGLIFGIFHMNPAQVVGATLIGFILAWIYYKTHSLIPCILIHIMNNSLSVYLALKFPDVEYSSELIGEKAYLTGLVIAFLLFILSWRMMNTYKLSNTTTEI